MKRAVSLKVKFVAVLTAIISVLTLVPASAATFFTNLTTVSCAGYGMTTSLVWANSITTPAATVVTSVDYKMSNSNFTGSRVQIRSDNAGAPSSTVLGTLNYSSFAGNIGTYTGSVSLPAAGKYWFALSSPTQSISPCYATTISTTGTAAGWSVGTTAYESNNSGSTFASSYTGYYFLFAIYGSGGVAASPSSISLSASSTSVFRTTALIVATLGVAGSDGLVTFYANGKKIPGCISMPSSALSASCNWRSSVIGSQNLSAKLVPTDSAFTASTSSAINIRVNPRTTTR